jgi:hypothetical protein
MGLWRVNLAEDMVGYDRGDEAVTWVICNREAFTNITIVTFVK